MSKIIRKNSGQSVQRWELPNVENIQTAHSDGGRGLTATPVTAEQIDKIQRDAYDEAYEAGFAKGLDDANQAATQQGAAINAVLSHFARPLQQLDREVETQLVQLVLAVTRQLVRREIKTDPGQIVAVVREALQVLPVNSRDVLIKLHPEDLQIIQQVLSDGDKTTFWRLSADATLERGDCRVQTESSTIDATLERRLTSVIANMLGGEREQDVSNATPTPDDTL